MQWQVALTTATRREPTLSQCLSSLLECGFSPMIFAEPESDISYFDNTIGKIKPYPNVLFHNERLGLYRNWVYAVKHILQTSADFYLTVQDDVILHPESKSFIESLDWPEDAGFVSLYTPKHYSLRPKSKSQYRQVGVNKVITRSLWGACALVLKKEMLETLINHPIATGWIGARPRSNNPAVLKNRRENPALIQNSDTCIGKVMNALKKSMYFIDPSPGQHIARFSAVNHGDNLGRRNAIRIADHSLPLHYQVFPNAGSN